MENGGWPTQARFWLEWGCSHVTDLVRRTRLDCPHAMGTNALSAQRAESFRHFLLLPSPPFAYHRRKPTNLRVGLGARAAQVQTSGLRVCGHAGACSSAAQRTAMGCVQRWNRPTQAKGRLEWATCPNCPTQAKGRLEWATCPNCPTQAKGRLEWATCPNCPTQAKGRLEWATCPSACAQRNKTGYVG